MNLCDIIYLILISSTAQFVSGQVWNGDRLVHQYKARKGCLWDPSVCRVKDICVEDDELGTCVDEDFYNYLEKQRLDKAFLLIKQLLKAEQLAEKVKNDDLLDYFDPGSNAVNTQSSLKSFPWLKQALIDASAVELSKSNETKEEENQPKALQSSTSKETQTSATVLRKSTVKIEESKVEIIKDHASIKNEMVPAGIRLGSDTDSDVIHKEEISDPWYQISSKDAFVIAAVVVAVVILVTVSSMALLFYMRGNENKLKKMLDFDNQINTNGSYKDLCQQRFDAKSSERLLGTNGDTVKDIKRESVRSARHPSSVSSWSEEPITSTLDIFSGHAILSYMEDHLQNTTRLDTEWNALCQYQADGVTYDAAMENIRKNRSSSLPFDHNRVKLHRDNNEGEESDYINASFIIDNDPTQPVYIACQGPLPSTVNDFWQMIWQQKCAAIVMLTPIIECGEVQCARYWPDEGSSQYGKYEIHLVSEHIWCEDYLVRSLYMKNVESGETRTLTQFHFLAFPHDSIPSSPIPLLEMRRKVSKCYRGTNTPIVVHCNDGVGRTGTYMLIDMVLNRIVKGKSREIDVAATLEHLRDQRANVVENKNQLQFALAAVAEEVNAMLKLNKGGN